MKIDNKALLALLGGSMTVMTLMARADTTMGNSTATDNPAGPGNQTMAYAGDLPDMGASGDLPDSLYNVQLPDVLTATRLRQPKTKVPASVTIIPGDLIRELGINTLWDVFRLVPGMTVGYSKSNNAVVSYHGTVADDQRRLQVLIDGRATYNVDLAEVDWHTMPVAMQDIQRIEVTRGPDAATYGINAFLAVINIITKSPQDTNGVSLDAMSGSKGFGHYEARAGQHVGRYDYRLSYLKNVSDGFDWRYLDQSGMGTKVPFNDAYNVDTLTYNSEYQFDNTRSLAVNGGATRAREDEDPNQYRGLGIITAPNKYEENYFGQIKWSQTLDERHSYYLQGYYQTQRLTQEWRSCLSLSAIDSALPDIPICGDANQNKSEGRADIEFQDTYRPLDNLRFVSGLSYRKDSYDSETFFNGSGEKFLSSLFTNIEYSPRDWLTTNVGAMWEHDSVNGTFFQPRYALNFPIADNQVVRLIFSKAYRTPDAFEQSANWSYTARNITPPLNGQTTATLISFKAPGGLQPEQIISREISYYGKFNVGQGIWSNEIKLFHDTLTNIISGRFDISNWDLQNDVNLRQQGVELETTLEYRRDYYRLTYAYLDQKGSFTGTLTSNSLPPDRYIDFQDRMTARNSGSAAWIHRFNDNITSSIAYYADFDLNTYPYQRIDTRIAKSFYFPRMTLEIAGVLQHYVTNDPIMYRDNNYQGQNQVFLELSSRF